MTNATNYHIGSTVRRMRKSRKMTQQQLAEASGLSRSTISNVEDALVSPNLDTLAALAGGLNCAIDVNMIPLDKK